MVRVLAGCLFAAMLVVGGAAPAFARPDLDGDGLFDDDEIGVYGTNPLIADSDFDGRNDGLEVFQGTDPRTPGPPPAPLKTCQDGTTVPAEQTCQKRCNDGSVVGEDQPCLKTCADGTRIFDNQTCEKRCSDGQSVPEWSPCPCPEGKIENGGSCVCTPGSGHPDCAIIEQRSSVSPYGCDVVGQMV